MINGPGLFSDIGKRANDLLTRDYISDQKFSISSCSQIGVAFTSTAVKQQGLTSGDVAALYKYDHTVIDVKLDTKSNIYTTFTIADIVPSTKAIASFKIPDYASSKERKLAREALSRLTREDLTRFTREDLTRFTREDFSELTREASTTY